MLPEHVSRPSLKLRGWTQLPRALSRLPWRKPERLPRTLAVSPRQKSTEISAQASARLTKGSRERINTHNSSQRPIWACSGKAVLPRCHGAWEATPFRRGSGARLPRRPVTQAGSGLQGGEGGRPQHGTEQGLCSAVGERRGGLLASQDTSGRLR